MAEQGGRMTDAAERIPIAADHAGFEMKEKIAKKLRALGYEVDDLGVHSGEATDYSDYAHPLAERVSSGAARRGVLLCGSGIGMEIAANRHRRVRASVIWTPEIAALARQHNDLNVLVLPARYISASDAERILQTWLETPFEGGRHTRRVEKIDILPS
jgi:ribose 5-phosphate isomerase B